MGLFDFLNFGSQNVRTPLPDNFLSSPLENFKKFYSKDEKAKLAIAQDKRFLDTLAQAFSKAENQEKRKDIAERIYTLFDNGARIDLSFYKPLLEGLNTSSIEVAGDLLVLLVNLAQKLELRVGTFMFKAPDRTPELAEKLAQHIASLYKVAVTSLQKGASVDQETLALALRINFVPLSDKIATHVLRSGSLEDFQNYLKRFTPKTLDFTPLLERSSKSDDISICYAMLRAAGDKVDTEMVAKISVQIATTALQAKNLELFTQCIEGVYDAQLLNQCADEAVKHEAGDAFYQLLAKKGAFLPKDAKHVPACLLHPEIKNQQAIALLVKYQAHLKHDNRGILSSILSLFWFVWQGNNIEKSRTSKLDAIDFVLKHLQTDAQYDAKAAAVDLKAKSVHLHHSMWSRKDSLSEKEAGRLSHRTQGAHLIEQLSESNQLKP